jgi:hypothetical protein
MNQVTTAKDMFTVLQPDKIKDAMQALKDNQVVADPNLLDRVKMPSGGGVSFSVPGPSGWEDVKVINAIILGFNDHRVYYEKSFDETGGGEQPDCSSTDMEVGKGNPGGNCNECPMNEWETAEKGKGKACTEKRLLMLLMPGELLPVKLEIPATSLQNVKKYFMRLASKAIIFHNVVTEFTLEEDKNDKGVKYSKIVFNKHSDLSDAEKAGVLNFSKALNK